MTFHTIGPDPLDPRRFGGRIERDDGRRPRPVTDAEAPAPADRVELSDESRAMAGGAEEARELGLTPERLAQIRARLDRGIYDRPEFLDAIAQRVVDSGDLATEPTE